MPMPLRFFLQLRHGQGILFVPFANLCSQSNALFVYTDSWLEWPRHFFVTISRFAHRGLNVLGIRRFFRRFARHFSTVKAFLVHVTFEISSLTPSRAISKPPLLILVRICGCVCRAPLHFPRASASPLGTWHKQTGKQKMENCTILFLFHA